MSRSPALLVGTRVLVSRKSQQLAKLNLSEIANLARTKRTETERPELATNQFENRMTDGCEHPPNDPVSTGVQLDLDHRLAERWPSNESSAICRNRSIVEFDSGTEPTKYCCRDFTANLRQICFRNSERWMREQVRELSVVCENKKSAGLGIEATDIE
jgi:hypothetical protein